MMVWKLWWRDFNIGIDMRGPKIREVEMLYLKVPVFAAVCHRIYTALNM